ncbi:MAG: hypothetical protein LBI43_04865 [Streptococcaceae bacterium]|jgi:predicted transcriptional regulator|nr:hypothetical protein [Streptococcaceae bacterium]
MKAILSIKSEYVERIFAGTKKYEFRKQIFQRDVDEILIYETAPTMRVVGKFTFEKILVNTPEKIWDETKEFSGIDFDSYMEYFRSKEIAYAIKIKEVTKYKKAQPLKVIAPELKMPPQSFAYVQQNERGK